MTRSCTICVVLSIWAQCALASNLRVPRTVQAGQVISIATEGNGNGYLYIVGPGGAVKKVVRMGSEIAIAPDEISNAGHYSVFLITPASTEAADFDVISSPEVASLSFLARPSRLPVGLHDGIGGVAYVFDAYHNLVLQSLPIHFLLTVPNIASESRTIDSHLGVAWIQMDSSSHAGNASFEAMAGDATSLRVLQQVPGDPCQLRMSARPAGGRLHVQTEPLRDCTGNLVADGTIVTFTEMFGGDRSTVDAPLKNGIAQADMPANKGAVITVAAGEVLGNQLRWNGGP
jgi:hypothetical protein